MKCLNFNYDYSKKAIDENELSSIEAKAKNAFETLDNKSGKGSDFLGWMDLPVNYDKKEFERIKSAAEYIQNNSDVLIVIGIGGSYLGARAVIEALKSTNYNYLCNKTPKIFFIGNSLSPTMLTEIMDICANKDICINVISKSGTTTEPAIAFRAFTDLIYKKYSKEEAAKRIFCTTDKSRGTLKELADEAGYQCFVIPDDVGGRYSVLTAVGLLPIAVAGIDIDGLMEGAADARHDYSVCDIEKNDCMKYASIRNYFYNKGKRLECFVSYEPSMAMFNEWLKQLFAESEGKDGKGLYPVSCIFSTDLHSVGQFIQESSSDLMFESCLKFNNTDRDYEIKYLDGNADGLNFLSGKKMSFVNEKARQGTLLAHTEGGVSNLIFEIDSLCAHDLGYIIYFFEKSCAISGYILDINPFNQPGVESYKKNMFALLGKPGYESQKETLEKELGLC